MDRPAFPGKQINCLHIRSSLGAVAWPSLPLSHHISHPQECVIHSFLEMGLPQSVYTGVISPVLWRVDYLVWELMRLLLQRH